MAGYIADTPRIRTLPIVGDMRDIHNILEVDFACLQALFCTISVIIRKS